MKRYSIELKALSPLAIRSDHAPGGAETAKFIAGTTLLGSLATLHRLLHNERTSEFESLFLNEKILYPNLYPAFFKDQEMQKSGFPVYPLPMTAQSCKRFSGFRYVFEGETRNDNEERHGVRDQLLDWAMFKLSSNNRRENASPIQELQRQKLCNHTMPNKLCGEAMDHFSGYYRREESSPYNMISAQTDTHTRLQTHTGINRESGTVQEGILYNRQVFEEDMCFWGMVKLHDTSDKLVTSFESFIEEVSTEGLVRIGTGRTRGLGKVSLEINPLKDKENRLDAFKKRLLIFHETLSAQAKDVCLRPLKPFYFALTLHSPLILCDNLLRYYGTIDGDTLAGLVGLPSSSFELVYQAASIKRVMGWNELWGTPRISEYAIDTGSVFLFASSLELEDAVLQSLFDLEEQGIGRRRAEGFGRVCISDPFHLEGELQ